MVVILNVLRMRGVPIDVVTRACVLNVGQLGPNTISGRFLNINGCEFQAVLASKSGVNAVSDE